MISVTEAGKNTSRINGAPVGPMTGSPSLTMTQPPMYQLAWLDPLANGHRPVTRKPPSTSTAMPSGRKAPAEMVAGSP